MAAGLGFKTFTTGEVLTAADTNGYLMQGINVFASAAARDAAITSPQEGQFAFTKDTNGLWYYDGAAWVASGATGDIEGVTAGIGISGGGTSGTVTVTNSMATAIDAKGDLVVGTAADTFSRLGVGADGTTIVADSSTATGLKWATPAASTPTFYGCQLYKSVSQSTSNNAYTALTFENEYVDVGGYHSGTSSKIIIPAGKAGTYLFTGQVSYATAASGLRFCAFYKNNSLVATGNSAFGSTTWDTTTGTLIMTLSVGDEIELVARQNSGGSLNVVGEDSDNFITRFGCVYLGA